MYAATPLYRARSVIILETRQEQILDLESVVGGLTGDSTVVNSEVEVLRARGLMTALVAELHLGDDPEFNQTLRPPGVIDRLQKFISPMAVPVWSARQTSDATVDRLLEQITVRNLPFSLVFTVTAESRDPEKSARIADTLVRLYIRGQRDAKSGITAEATAWLTGQVATLQAELEASERRVADFSSATDLVSRENLQALERQLKDLRLRVADAEDVTQQAQQRVAALAAATVGQPGLNRADEGRQGGAAITRARQNATRLSGRQLALAGSLAGLEQRLAGQNADLIRLQQLGREAEASRQLYEHFLTRLKETAVQQGVHRPDSRILSRAVVPMAPSSPRLTLILVISALCGAVLGEATVLLRQMRRLTVLSAKELEDATGYTVLGEIPLMPGRNREAILNYLVEKPMSSAAEAVRNLRTSILLSETDPEPKVILSTSALPGEGKTTMALALARNLSDLGKRVLLIEGDIRQQVFTQYFDNQPGNGMLSVFTGKAPLIDAAQFSPEAGADILIGHQSLSNAADMFASEEFSALIREARKNWDIVLIDSPPVLLVPEARVIGQHVDAVLFTVRWNHTTRAQIDAGLKMFESLGQKVIGLVLSQVNPRRAKRYGSAGGYDSGKNSIYYQN